MKMSLTTFRNDYLETLLRFLWREWTALGIAGQEKITLRHVVDPEALLLFTCAIGRYDQRLFDEVMDWLTKNGRFLNIQRMRNILNRESFSGGEVLGAMADWLSQREDPMKWNLLAKIKGHNEKNRALFFLPDGRKLPCSNDNDETFLSHGLTRNPITLRGYSQKFPPDALPSLFLKIRALFGVNARCDVLVYLALNGAGHPREVARELYYSQKAIHDVMTDMEYSGVVHSSRSARERTFRITPDSLPFLTDGVDGRGWINWPNLLSTAEIAWRLTEELRADELDPLVETSEIALTMSPLLDRLTRARWAPAIPNTQPTQGILQLQAFHAAFKTVVA